MLSAPNVVAPISASTAVAKTTGQSPPPTLSATDAPASSVYSDSFALPTISAWRTILAVVGYLLLITDVARSGASLSELGYPTLEPNVFASGPPTVLLAQAIVRTVDASDPSKAAMFSVTTSGSSDPVEFVDPHWYKHSSTSYGLRTMYSQRPAALASWPACLQREYDETCGATLPAKTIFTMLDHLISTVRDNANETTCYKTMVTYTADGSERSVSAVEGELTRDYLGTLPQRVRFAVRAKARWLDGASNFLSHHVLDHKYWLSVWATHYDDFNATRPGMEICADELDRPLFCEKSWADFKHLSPTHVVGKLWDDISDRAAALQAANPGKTLEMSIVETETDPLTLFGGAALIAHKLYDVVVLYRVMDCLSSTCTTAEIHEIRYGGRVLYTDVIEWKSTTAVLRWTAQVYVWLRLVFLFAGCYYAAPFVKRSSQDAPSPLLPRLRITMSLFFTVPPQVVVYASFVPVLLYSSAHVIDGVAHYHLLADRLASLSTLSSHPLEEIVRVLSIYTRNLWLAAIAVRVLVFIDTSGGWTPASGVSGVRGYLLPLLSSAVFILRGARFEDARVLESNEVEPSTTFMVIRAETLDSWKMNAGGVYQDILTVGMATVLYISAVVLFRVTTKLVAKRKDVSWWPEAICWIRCDVPYAAGYLWDPSCLAIAWEDDLIDRVLGNKVERTSQQSVKKQTGGNAVLPASIELGDFQTRNVLMNITFLSDPWNWLAIKLGHTRLHLYQLRVPGKPTRKILHPFPKTRFQSEFDIKHEEIVQVKAVNASELTWGQLIMCR